jgi:hypothetical protein
VHGEVDWGLASDGISFVDFAGLYDSIADDTRMGVACCFQGGAGVRPSTLWTHYTGPSPLFFYDAQQATPFALHE